MDDSGNDNVALRAVIVDGVLTSLGAEEGALRYAALGSFVNHHGSGAGWDFVGHNARAVLANSDAPGGYDLLAVDRRTGNRRVLIAGQTVIRAFWSEQLGKVVATTRDAEVVLVDPEAPADATVLLSHALTPAVSPDGRKLAYARLRDDWTPGSLAGSTALHVLDLETREDVELTSDFDDAEPIWSPDQTELLFLSGGRTGLQSFWRIGADGAGLRQLTNVGRSLVDDQFVPSPSLNEEVEWSKDGEVLLYGAHYAAEGEVRALDFGAAGDLPLALDLGVGLQPRWVGARRIESLRVGAGELMLERRDVDSGEGGTLAVAAGELTTPLSAAQRRLRERPEPAPLSHPDSLVYTDDPGGAALRFQYPMNDFYPVNFAYDNDAGSGLLDHNCASNTYNGHKGTDFDSNYGNNLYAAAAGTISDRHDGCPTTGYWGSQCGGGFGNHVRMDHGNEWRTVQAHMTNGTVVAAGYKQCGAFLGVSGSSGFSSGPHLHFEVLKYGYPYDDPYAGSCSGPEQYWTDDWSCQ